MPMREKQRFRHLTRWGPPVAWMALIFLLSAQPGLRVSDDPGVDLPIRHLAHVLAYGVLAALLLRALPPKPKQRFAWRNAAVALALATLYGVTDEVHQAFVPLRTGHLVDVGWDGLGALAGILAARLAVRRRGAGDSVGARPD